MPAIIHGAACLNTYVLEGLIRVIPLRGHLGLVNLNSHSQVNEVVLYPELNN